MSEVVDVVRLVHDETVTESRDGTKKITLYTVQLKTRSDGSHVVTRRNATYALIYPMHGKRYGRWITNYAGSYEQGPDGTIIARVMSHKKGWKTQVLTSDQLPPPEEFQAVLRRYFTVRTRRELYPLCPNAYLPTGAETFYRNTDSMSEVVRRVVGAKRAARMPELESLLHPKTVNSAVVTQLCFMLRGHVDDDDLLRIARAVTQSRRHIYPIISMRAQRATAKRMEPSVLVEALTSDPARAIMLLNDMRGAAKFLPASADSLDGYHDEALQAKRNARPARSYVRSASFDRAWGSAPATGFEPVPIARALFGSHYRRDLVKAMAACHRDVVFFGWLFVGHVPIDWIVDFYRRNAEWIASPVWPILTPAMRLVREMDTSSHRKMLRADADAWMNIVNRLQDGRLRIPAHIDSVASLTNSLNHQTDRLIELEQAEREEQYAAERAAANEREKARIASLSQNIERIASRFDGHTPGGLRIETARTRDTLSTWGNEMSNCIGGFARDLGSHALLGVYRDDELIVNVQVDTFDTVRQMYGPMNRRIASDVAHDVTAYLVDLGVLCSAKDWVAYERATAF